MSRSTTYLLRVPTPAIPLDTPVCAKPGLVPGYRAYTFGCRLLSYSAGVRKRVSRLLCTCSDVDYSTRIVESLLRVEVWEVGTLPNSSSEACILIAYIVLSQHKAHRKLNHMRCSVLPS